ncbi:DUF2306 domain-containing protein [Maricaulis sp.]|uniref:DUF2306 domain-containing protein n=1 Tax=Maricaulis sp. TaxID=1486257 RepID=UPI002614CCAC|nr:DUF2306 domain-containing protein [Maricaulis sp.]
MSMAAAEALPGQGVSLAHKVLKSTGVLWFLVATAGQWIFVYYILAAYGPSTLSGNFAAWDDTGLISGYVENDLVGNLFFASHVFLAVFMTAAATLQLTPPVRKRFPTFHRWTGRSFIVIALILALGGFYMTWGRGVRLSDIGALGVSLNTVLIVSFSLLTLYFAMRRKINIHRRWAMRTFIVVHGVWFFRLSLMGWFVLNQGPNGNTRMLDGPADITISFACYLVPLLILELYQRAADSRQARPKWVMSGVILLAVAATGLGVFAAYMMMWSPHF